ncbi:MAG: thioredoxin domain-containing protein, partial [Proteobacteria bacterium]|nr:thioredoxin domain-containing protein [Pseudomonadota bacterium]
EQILAELKEIRRLLEQRKAADAPAPPGKVRLADVGTNVIGSSAAPLTLVTFTDYQCPFCRRFFERTWPELKRRYVDSGQLRFVVRDMPLNIHEQALPAALAARCAGEQGRFAPVFDALFRLPELTPQAVQSVVTAAGVAPGPYASCVARAGQKAAIDADENEAERLGINGTPGFVLAQKSGAELEGTLIVGAQPTEVFTSRIDALLAAPHTR